MERSDGIPCLAECNGCYSPQQCSLERGSHLLLPNVLWTQGPALSSQRSSRTTTTACRHMCPHGDTPYVTVSPSQPHTACRGYGDTLRDDVPLSPEEIVSGGKGSPHL